MYSDESKEKRNDAEILFCFVGTLPSGSCSRVRGRRCGGILLRTVMLVGLLSVLAGLSGCSKEPNVRRALAKAEWEAGAKENPGLSS